ncbi:NUDIX hydrolase [Clostridium pasteurianum]|uniref:Isopentenyldiphosphate isomerase n=1 Tax=Clostridium pasteurianum BC1 TaxID=86416 RepID=R4K4Q6_CLOPA|nr:NUDIX domain-containing protein [Clostridium pasteurianum]AGK97543.1 isopentenyldiphosphate isomerase [Clostridium pasteurianum BC1]
MELWDILDGNGDKTGKTIQRGKTMEQDEYHLVVNVWIKNNNGEFLITKRTPNKQTFPNMWETTCGAAVIGEDSLKAALREVKEEISIDLSPTNGKCLFRLKRQHNGFPDFVDVWLFKEEVDIADVIYQPEEVCAAKWATPSQILSLIETGKFTDTFTYLRDLFKII